MRPRDSAKSRWLGVFLTLAFLGWSGPTWADEAKPVTVTDKDNDGKVSLTKGQELVVRLEIRTGTGFTWEVSPVEGKRLEQLGKPALERGSGGRAGGPAFQVFRFKAVRAGTTTLELNYRRPFEKNAKPARTFKIKVTVKEAP